MQDCICKACNVTLYHCFYNIPQPNFCSYTLRPNNKIPCLYVKCFAHHKVCPILIKCLITSCWIIVHGAMYFVYYLG